MVDVILTAQQTIAQEWRALAVAWHAAALLLVLVIITGPATARAVGAALTLPLFSVSALAWWSGNPFTTIVFAAGGGALLAIAGRLSSRPLEPPAASRLAAGLALCAFGFAYPHFLGGMWWRYLYEAPLGLIPCPTVAFVIGVSMMAGSFGSRAWKAIVTALGIVYGAIGVFALGVTLDWVLLAGAVLLGLQHRSALPHIEQARLFKHRRTV